MVDSLLFSTGQFLSSWTCVDILSETVKSKINNVCVYIIIEKTIISV